MSKLGVVVLFLGSGAFLIFFCIGAKTGCFSSSSLFYMCLFCVLQKNFRLVCKGHWWAECMQIIFETDQFYLTLCLQVLQTLGTETYRPSSASQCVAGIACAEIPVNQWPELIPQLVANVTNPNSTEHMKESTLEAIGYICQDIVSAVWHI